MREVPTDEGRDPVLVTVVLEPAGPGRLHSRITVGDRPPMTGSFELPARGWDRAYEGAQTSQDGAAIGPAIDIGTRLFDGLFSGPLRRCWAQAVEDSAGREMRLVVHSGSPAVHGLPWELLYDQALAEGHVALVDGWSVLRTVPDPPDPPAPVRGVAELEVLVVTSQPDAGIESDFEILTAAWPEASVRLCRAEGTADIAEALRGRPVDLLHIACSGIELPDGRQYLRLGDPNSCDPLAVVALVSGTELVEVLEETGLPGQLPGMVVLAGSETEVIAAEVARRIPVVLGLRSAVSDVELDPFLREFYPLIGRGEVIERAMAAARTAQRDVSSALGTDWAAPVGYFVAGQRLVAPDAHPGPADRAPSSTDRVVVLTGDAGADAANLRREVDGINVRTLLERWTPVEESLWPDPVVRQRTRLWSALAAAPTVPTPPRPDVPDPATSSAELLPRALRAYRRLTDRRDTATRLAAVIEPLAGFDLLVVAGERWLHDQLGTLLEAAAEALERLTAVRTVDLTDVRRLEVPLESVHWSVADETIVGLARLGREQAEFVRAATEDLDTHRLWFDRYRRELSLAIDAGVQMSPEDRQMLTEGDVLRRDAETAAKRGEFGAVVVALRTVRADLERRKLWDPATFEEHLGRIARARREAEQRAAVMAHRSELILIAATQGQPNGVPRPLEYGVLLRRPSLDAAQESNLHHTMKISTGDRRRFLAVVDDVARSATSGVRGVGWTPPPAAESEPDPADELEKTGRLMYNLLVPNGMQFLLRDTAPCPLTVSSNDLELPWELLHDGTDFLCVQRPFARMPVGKTYPHQRRWTPPNRTAWNMLLVHSDPDGTLRDSHREITEIQAIFNDLPQVNATVLDGDRATEEQLTRHLNDGRYDLIHYAGHARFDLDRPDESYLVMQDGSPFPAERIKNVLEGRPVVFLNACETLRTENEDERTSPDAITVQAQGLASAFIYGGAQACVGALWPVYDDSARVLAVAFYQALLARKPVGEALRSARELSREQHADRLTWAAYALYGDPRFKLREGAPASHVPAVVELG